MMQTKENRNRMWIFILLYILGLNTSQASGEDNSTQMYYVKLMIEKSAIANITGLLKPFVSNTTLHVDDLEKTTNCQNVSASTECTCESGYRWSDEECKSTQKCCSDATCTFPKNSSPMCVSDTTVTITGSMVLNGQQYLNCLAKKNSDKYNTCNDALLKEMKEVYSTLRGFDTLTITKYRAGSLIVDFEMTFAHDINPKDLINKTTFMSSMLSASLTLETTGFVHLSMPANPVCYEKGHNLTCKVKKSLDTVPVWQLRKGSQVFDITNGTESVVTMERLETKVSLKNISELWAGEYTCVYRQQLDNFTISHKASAVIDVSVLPNIYINTVPGFPRCRKKSDLLTVKVQCEIESSKENYTVTWSNQHITADMIPVPLNSSDGVDVYAVETIVGCNSSAEKPQLKCTFKNRCNQERTASVDVNIIFANEQFCAAEGDWEEAKAGFTAVLKCKNAVGQRRRKCKKGLTEATWESEFSACVNREVNNVLQKANIVDIGLGTLDGNAAHVFSLLEGVTNNLETINTFANMDASVGVLFTLSQKQGLQPNQSTADDFLESSSNLLEKSLTESWETKADEGNDSLAGKYLSSVEHLIQVANITGVFQKKNIEVAKSICSQGSQCTNKVFNVTVHLDSPDPGYVKTAGFIELENYLPNSNDKYKPNTIVVSTTTEKKQLDSIEVKINFPLLKPRPRNVKLKCVSWDNKTGAWSTYGCKWDGPSNEGHCTCTHLSSFAILMSRYPLDVPWITEITYAGLSISVISLIISLAIELIVWTAVVKTNTLHLRHTAHVNISLCLLVADCCFLASSKPSDISRIWCKTFVVVKHFCFLSMFFWMLCLSTTLLHQAVFLFHNVSKKNYMRYSFLLGYVCPLLIVTVTFLANKAGAEGVYFSAETCWLVYTGLMKGSIHTFVIPVTIIVFVNVFSMAVVIMKLLDLPKNTETSEDKEKKAALTVMRSVILLTPVFGVTWIFGFAVMVLDLTSGYIAFAVNYAFVLLNTLQGFFILVVTCLVDRLNTRVAGLQLPRLTREALLNRLKKRAPASTKDSSTTLDSTLKK